MTNSHLIGFVTFGAFALFALLSWVVSYKHAEVTRDRAMRRKARVTALCLLIGGATFSYFAFSIDNEMRVTTLHEEMVEGSMDVIRGSGAPVRTIAFMVEHPSVEHELFLNPDAERFNSPKFAVEVAFALLGPTGKPILAEQVETFKVRPASRNNRANWEGKTFTFIPSVAGPHTLSMSPITIGIPRVHVRIADPLKRDGERISGY